MLSNSSLDFAGEEGVHSALVSTPVSRERVSGGGLGLDFDWRPLRVCMGLMDSDEVEQLGI